MAGRAEAPAHRGVTNMEGWVLYDIFRCAIERLESAAAGEGDVSDCGYNESDT